MNYPITRLTFDDAERRLLTEVLDSGWVAQGPRVAAFEAAFAREVGGGEAVAVSSCTAGLHVLMLALGVKAGDEVIVPAFTWIATANAVELAGGRAVFVDVDPATFNVRPDVLAAAITPRTVGIVAVHLFGRCADMDAINAIAERHGLWVVEDAACAAGSTYRGRPAGRLARAGVFSFHPRKTITTGEGGMITTDDAALAEKCRSLRNHGAGPAATVTAAGMADFVCAGLNYRLTDLQAALGLAQLAKLNRLVAARRAVADAYRAALADCPHLILPADPTDGLHSYQSFVVLFAPGHELPPTTAIAAGGARRDELMARLAAIGVATRPGTHAPVLASYYRDQRGWKAEDFPGAWRCDHLSIALPLYPGLTDGDVAIVAGRLRPLLADTFTIP